MVIERCVRGLAVALALACLGAVATADAPAPVTTITTIDLGQAFAAKSNWRFVATQRAADHRVLGA